jgi:hypothetical protein
LLKPFNPDATMHREQLQSLQYLGGM